MNSVMRRCSAFLIALIMLLGSYCTVSANNHEENEIYEVLTRSNLRDTPSVEGKWIMTIPGGAFVVLLNNAEAEYVYVSYEGIEGYIYSGCIRRAEIGAELLEQEAPVSEQGPTIPATVLEYSQPNTNTTILVSSVHGRNDNINIENIDTVSETQNLEEDQNINEDSTEVMSTDELTVDEIVTEGPSIPATVVEYSHPSENSSILVADHGNGETNVDTTQSATVTGEANVAMTQSATVTGSVLANAVMRESPSAEGRKLETISDGSEIVYIDAGENGYVHISYQGREGYLYGRCIELSDQTLSSVSGVENTVVTTAPVVAAGNQPIMLGSASESVSSADTTSTPGAGINPSNIAASASQRQENSTAAAAAMTTDTMNTTAVQTTTATQAVATATNTNQTSAMNSTTQVEATSVAQQTAQATQEAIAAANSDSISYQISARANMRRDPTQNSERLMTLPVGADVVVLGQSAGGYTMVQYDGMQGYVLENCITDAVDLSKLGTEPVLFTVTGYCPCRLCCGNYSPEVTGRESRTATGTIPTQGRTIAVDPSVIPYGTQVVIEGLGTYVAEDCGGMIQSNHIDVYFDNHQDALNFGSRRLYVTIVQ